MYIEIIVWVGRRGGYLLSTRKTRALIVSQLENIHVLVLKQQPHVLESGYILQLPVD